MTANSEHDFWAGGCPVCCKPSTDILNIRKNHWATCHEHQVCWSVGYNLFSSWQEETEEDWTRNAQRLQGYKIVKPWYPEPEPTKLTEKEKAELDNALLCWSLMSKKMQSLFLGKISDTEPF